MNRFIRFLVLTLLLLRSGPRQMVSSFSPHLLLLWCGKLPQDCHLCSCLRSAVHFLMPMRFHRVHLQAIRIIVTAPIHGLMATSTSARLSLGRIPGRDADLHADGRAGVAYPTADARSDQARRLAASHRKGGLYCLYPYTLTELDLLVIY